MKPEGYEVNVSRTLDATPERAWRAWVDPADIKQWWGPHGFTVPVAEMDFRVGGTSLIGMSAPEFGDFYTLWTYEEIVPHERIVFVLRFRDENARPPGVPEEVRHLITFEPVPGGKTRLTVREFGYPEAQTAEISQAGLEQTLDKLVIAVRD